MMGFIAHMLEAIRNYGTEPEQPVAPVIEFVCRPEYAGRIPEPISAGKRMPEWFKRIKPEVQDGGRDHFGAIGSSAKRCLPMIDAMTLGFVIPLFADVNIRTSQGKHMTIGPTPVPVADTHGKAQLGGAASPTPYPAVKFLNKWVVKTPPGWSTLFVSPLNGTEERFTCLSAVVDTDVYASEINFPAIWHADDYDGVVKAGTPLVTAIPFRRDTTNIEHLIRKMTPHEEFEYQRTRQIQDTRGGYYTQELREAR